MRTSVHHGAPAKARGLKRPTPRSCLGPVSDLEAHLPAERRRKLFNALYVKTDGDVVENVENTRRDVDFIVSAAAVQPTSQILDLCCGQGRHCLELARRGFKNVTCVYRPGDLVRLAKKRAQSERLQVVFKEGAGSSAAAGEQVDRVAMMGNWFGDLSDKQDDEKVLGRSRQDPAPVGPARARHNRRRLHGRSLRAPLWGADRDEHHFVCRERSLSGDPRAAHLARGDSPRRVGG